MMIFRNLVLFGIVVLFSLAGCGGKEDSAQSPHDTGDIPLESKPMMAGPAEVSIPDEIKAAWKGIKVEITDNETGTKEVVEINIGEDKLVEGTGLKVKAISFLPAFQMNGPIVTSTSNETENPAAQIEISEGESQLFSGWLFTLYPTTHAFTHPKYSIALMGGVAADKI